MNPLIRLIFLCFLVYLICGLTSCNFGANQNTEEQRQRDDKTREEAAKATERAKPEIQAAGRALGRAAETAVEDAHAAAQGIQEGWKQRTHDPANLNSAAEKDLSDLPGLSRRDARRIIQGRPYHDKHELVTKGILPETVYAKIRDSVT